MAAVGFVSGLAAATVSGNRSIVIAASAVGFL
jgi:hypothetical protein